MLLGTKAQQNRPPAPVQPWGADDPIVNDTPTPSPTLSAPIVRPTPPPLRQIAPPTIGPAESARIGLSQAQDAREAAEQPLKMQQMQGQIAKTQAEIDALNDKQDKTNPMNPARREGTLSTAKNVFRAANMANQQIGDQGWGTLGLTGMAMRQVPGTEASDLEANLDTMRSNFAFENLKKMREESPTGGAVGNVSDNDLRLLAATVTNLQTSQSAGQLKSNIKYATDMYRDILTKLGYSPDDIAVAAGDDSAKVAIPGAAPPGAGTAGGTPPSPPTTSRWGGPQAPDEELIRADQEKPDTGYRLKPEQESQIAEAIRAGDEGQALALIRQFSGQEPVADTIKSVRTLIKQAKSNPNAPIGMNYGLVDQAAKDAAEYEKYGNHLQEARAARDTSKMSTIGAGATKLDAGVRGAADTVSLGLADRAAAVGDMLGGGSYEDNLRKERALSRADEELNFGSRLTGQIGGGMVLPEFGGPLRNFPAAARAAEAATYGGGYGFNTRYGDLGENLQAGANTALPAMAMGTVGSELAAGIGSKAAQRAVKPSMTEEVADAASRQGVPITVADVKPGARGLLSNLESLPIISGVVNRKLTKGNDAIERRVAEVGGPGDVLDTVGLGDTIRKAGDRYIEQSGAAGGRAYSIADRLAAGEKINPEQMLANLDAQIADLSRTPNTNKEVLGFLKSYRDDIVQRVTETPEDTRGGFQKFLDQLRGIEGPQPVTSEVAKPLDVDSLRNMRTSLRGRTNTDQLRGTDAQRRASEALDAATGDINAQLNPRASRAYKRADAIWKARSEKIDRVVETFLGGKGDEAMSAEKVANNITRLSSPKTGDSRVLEQMLGTLKPDELKDVAATIAARLGRRGEDAENDFSSNLFFTQLQRFSPKARKALWGEQGAKDLADLAAIAEQRGKVLGKMNVSASGRVGNFLKVMSAVLGAPAAGGAAAAGATGGVGGVASGLGAAYVTAKLLGSPKAVSLLAYAARASTLQKQSTAIRRMSQLIARDPSLEDLIPIKQKLEEAWQEDYREKRPDKSK